MRNQRFANPIYWHDIAGASVRTAIEMDRLVHGQSVDSMTIRKFTDILLVVFLQGTRGPAHHEGLWVSVWLIESLKKCEWIEGEEPPRDLLMNHIKSIRDGLTRFTRCADRSEALTDDEKALATRLSKVCVALSREASLRQAWEEDNAGCHESPAIDPRNVFEIVA